MRRLRLSRFTLGHAAILAGAAATVVAMATLLPQQTGRDGSGDARSVAGARDNVYVDPDSGVSFVHPKRWSVKAVGGEITVQDPTGAPVVTVIEGPAGDALDVSGALLAQLRDAYRDVQVTQAVEEPGGVRVSGEATNREGAPVRFFFAVVEGRGDRTFAASAFVTEPRARTTAIVEELLSSLTVAR